MLHLLVGLVLMADTDPSPSLAATVGHARCPSHVVRVTVTNSGTAPGFYRLLVGGRLQHEESIKPDTTLNSNVIVGTRPVRIEVRYGGHSLVTARRHAACDTGGGTTKPRHLPFTGAGDLYAKGATALAALLTGGIVFWYAFLWPRSGRGDWACLVERSNR